jgi:hypothetical protein
MSLDAMGIGSIADLLKDGIDKIWPDPAKAAEAKIAILQAEQSGALKDLDDQFQLSLEQIKADAAGEQKPGLSFRDGAGWVCVFGLAFSILKSPVEWGFQIFGHPITLPVVDTSTTTTMLLALLGVGGMHLYENTNNNATVVTKK